MTFHWNNGRIRVDVPFLVYKQYPSPLPWNDICIAGQRKNFFMFSEGKRQIFDLKGVDLALRAPSTQMDGVFFWRHLIRIANQLRKNINTLKAEWNSLTYSSRGANSYGSGEASSQRFSLIILLELLGLFSRWLPTDLVCLHCTHRRFQAKYTWQRRA